MEVENMANMINNMNILVGHDLESQKIKNQKALKVLQEIWDDDKEEQKETFDFLRTALDEDRPSYRKLFP